MKPAKKQQSPADRALAVKRNLDAKVMKVKRRLLSGRTITATQSMRWYRYQRLADGIFQLRNPPHNMNIETIMVDGFDLFKNPVHYGRYRWLGEKPLIFLRHRSSLKHKAATYDFIHAYPMKIHQVKKHIIEYLRKRSIKVKKIGVLRSNVKNMVLASTNKGTRIFVLQQSNAALTK